MRLKKNQEDSGYDFDSVLKDWSNECLERLENLFKLFENKIEQAEKKFT